MGALKVSTLGGPGLRQMSVEASVVSWKEVDDGEGGVSLLFANLNASWDAIFQVNWEGKMLLTSGSGFMYSTKKIDCRQIAD
jgi:hypothetical protein